MAGFSWDEYPYRVVSAQAVTPVIRELWLEPLGEALPYRAGHYVLLTDDARRVPQRSYSVANAPRADGKISLLVTLVPGGPTSTWAHELAPGGEVSIEGPYGTFLLSPEPMGPVLLLGAGSGLAPVRALAEQLVIGDSGADGLAAGRGAGGRLPGPVTLYFSGRTAADAIDQLRFEAWAREFPDFDYRLTCTRQPSAPRSARVPDLLRTEFETLSGATVFTAGPPGFVAGCDAAARALGATTVRTEEFFTDPVPWSGALPPIPDATIYARPS